MKSPALPPVVLLVGRAIRRCSPLALVVASAALVCAAPAEKPKAPPAAPGKSQPAAPATQDKEPVIAGITVPRPNGTFLGVEVVGNRLKVTFYDATKEKMAPDVARAAARWDPPRGNGMRRGVLNPGGSGTLDCPIMLDLPHTYKVYMVLLDKDGNSVESFVIDLHDLDGGDDKGAGDANAGGAGGTGSGGRTTY